MVSPDLASQIAASVWCPESWGLDASGAEPQNHFGSCRRWRHGHIVLFTLRFGLADVFRRRGGLSTALAGVAADQTLDTLARLADVK
jgi:hypothetical protein